MINLGLVPGNTVMGGPMNATREYLDAGGEFDLSRADLEFPGRLSKLLTSPVDEPDTIIARYEGSSREKYA